MVMIFIMSVRRKYPIHGRLDVREIWSAFKEGLPPLFTPVIILGGIMGGIFTPTEAAVAASAYALFLGVVIYREINLADLPGIILGTAVTTAIVLFIISTAAVYGWLLAREQVPQHVAQMLFSITTNPQLIMLILIGFLLVVGCFMETTASIIILVPVLVPMVTQLGIDPLLFGLVMVFTLMLGLITPPVGVVLYLIADIAGISFERTVIATLPFLIPLVIVLLLVAFVPQIPLFLPNLLMP
jgi:tripartite ATP-independent transporter DctM subunit